jgi:hypothetical protein
MDLFDISQFVDLSQHSFFENLTGLKICDSQEPFHFLFLLSMRILINSLQSPQPQYILNQFLPFLLALGVGLVD